MNPISFLFAQPNVRRERTLPMVKQSDDEIAGFTVNEKRFAGIGDIVNHKSCDSYLR